MAERSVENWGGVEAHECSNSPGHAVRQRTGSRRRDLINQPLAPADWDLLGLDQVTSKAHTPLHCCASPGAPASPGRWQWETAEACRDPWNVWLHEQLPSDHCAASAWAFKASCQLSADDIA
ncbi:hypothetical protein GN956_G2018 [Arapaima gigas]